MQLCSAGELRATPPPQEFVKKIPSILWKAKIHFSVHIHSPLAPGLNQTKLLHTLTHWHTYLLTYILTYLLTYIHT